jgi:hypothetical protein
MAGAPVIPVAPPRYVGDEAEGVLVAVIDGPFAMEVAVAVGGVVDRAPNQVPPGPRNAADWSL